MVRTRNSFHRFRIRPSSNSGPNLNFIHSSENNLFEPGPRRRKSKSSASTHPARYVIKYFNIYESLTFISKTTLTKCGIFKAFFICVVQEKCKILITFLTPESDPVYFLSLYGSLFAISCCGLFFNERVCNVFCTIKRNN